MTQDRFTGSAPDKLATLDKAKMDAEVERRKKAIAEMQARRANESILDQASRAVDIAMARDEMSAHVSEVFPVWAKMKRIALARGKRHIVTQCPRCKKAGRDGAPTLHLKLIGNKNHSRFYCDNGCGMMAME